MADKLPKFRRPPVVETALSVQFSPLLGLSNAHLGWYWGKLLGPKDWPQVIEQPRLIDLPERFDDVNWSNLPGGIGVPFPFGRFQFIRADQERMIQVQNSRFIYNWRRRENEYPTFDKILPEFESHLNGFTTFCKQELDVEPMFAFWELIYVNHIFQGELWKQPVDWPKILPGLLIPHVSEEASLFETANGEWHFRLHDSRGRLRIAIMHARFQEHGQQEALVVQITARGSAGPEKGYRVLDGLNIGHAAIVKTFTNITSQRAHDVWERMQ